jgi:hypothetical protein
LLREIRRIFNQQDEGATALSSAELTTQLMGIEGSPWTKLSGQYGDELTVNKLSKMLNPLGIKTKKYVVGKTPLGGYKFPDFGDAFDRYLPKDDESNDDIEWDYAFGDPYAIYDGESHEIQFSIIPIN